MRGWCLTDSFIEDFKALHCFSQLKVIRIMAYKAMKRVILESQVSRELEILLAGFGPSDKLLLFNLTPKASNPIGC